MSNDCIANKKIDIGVIIMIFGFLFSFSNNVTLSIWIIGYSFFIIVNQSIRLGINFFILLQFRSLLSSGVAIEVGNVSLLKWASLIGISLFLLIKCEKDLSPEIKKLRQLLICFSVYLVGAALLTSSYPLVAVFKIVSYVLPFVAIIEAVSISDVREWMHLINAVLGTLIVVGLFLYKSSIGYLRNGRFFQGVFNHPNVMAVMCTIFLAGLWYEYNQKKKRMIFYILIGICAFSIYCSYSRTGMISFIFILIVGVCSLNTKTSNKIAILISITSFVAVVISLNTTWREEIVRFVFKGGTSIYDITNSRENQFERNIQRFLHSPLLGTGLNVPYVENVRSFSFSFDLITENGNIILALLGDMGILGTILFIICYSKVFEIGRYNRNGYTLFIVPFLVCMGEMAFFSTNNFGIILYLYFAIYMSDKEKRREITEDENTVYNNNTVTI